MRYTDRVLTKVVGAQVSSLPGRAYTEYYAGYIRLEGKIFSIGSEDSHEWLHNDEEKFEINNNTYLVNLCLDIKIQKSECSKLYLIPIASNFGPSSIGCLIVRSISMAKMEFERVGTLFFEPYYLLEVDTQLHLIWQYASAEDPFLGNLDTITIF